MQKSIEIDEVGGLIHDAPIFIPTTSQGKDDYVFFMEKKHFELECCVFFCRFDIRVAIAVE